MTPSIVERVDELFPQLVDDLCALAAVPSIAFPGFPAEPVRAAHDLVVGLLADLGVTGIRTLELADTAPAILADIPGPPGAPTVRLYAHYDVQPPGDEWLWHTPPFTPTRIDGTIYGRGVADDKANPSAHLGALPVFGGRYPDWVRGSGGVRQRSGRLPAAASQAGPHPVGVSHPVHLRARPVGHADPGSAGRLCHVSRPLVITAWSAAPGWINLFAPTTAVLIGGLALARVSYAKYLRVLWPLLAVLLVLTCGIRFVAAEPR